MFKTRTYLDFGHLYVVQIPTCSDFGHCLKSGQKSAWNLDSIPFLDHFIAKKCIQIIVRPDFGRPKWLEIWKVRPDEASGFWTSRFSSVWTSTVVISKKMGSIVFQILSSFWSKNLWWIGVTFYFLSFWTLSQKLP